MSKVVGALILMVLLSSQEMIAQVSVPIQPIIPTLKGEGIEQIIRYSIKGGGGRTINLKNAYQLGEDLVLLQGQDQDRPDLLGLHMLSVGQHFGNTKYRGIWASAQKLDSLPEHYAMQLQNATMLENRLFLQFSMEFELPFGLYFIGIEEGKEDMNGFVEVIKWDSEVNDWGLAEAVIKEGLFEPNLSFSDGIYCFRLEGEYHVVPGKRLRYKYVKDKGFVIDTIYYGFHQLKVKGEGTLRYYALEGNIVFMDQPNDLLKAANAVSDVEGKQDLLLFANWGAFEAHYLRALDGEKYLKEWKDGYLGRLLGGKLE